MHYVFMYFIDTIFFLSLSDFHDIFTKPNDLLAQAMLSSDVRSLIKRTLKAIHKQFSLAYFEMLSNICQKISPV